MLNKNIICLHENIQELVSYSNYENQKYISKLITKNIIKNLAEEISTSEDSAKNFNELKKQVKKSLDNCIESLYQISEKSDGTFQRLSDAAYKKMKELEGLRKELILLESVNESNLMFYTKVVGRFVLRIVAAVLFILVTIGLAKSVGPLGIVVAAIGAVTASFGVYGIIMTTSEEILSKIAKEKDINNLSKDKKNELEKKVNDISKELIKIKKQF
jgi:hypothetical protein